MTGRKGQTLIETALALILIMIILLGITEFARAWFTKNSLKNGVRQGARVAAVTPVASLTPTSFTCTAEIIGACPNTNALINAVCCQPGIKAGTLATLTCPDTEAQCDTITAGGTVKMTANFTDPNFFIVGGGIWPWPQALNITVDASMRYE